VIGGAIVVLALAFIAWILIRRRRRRQEEQLIESALTVDPFSPAPLRSAVSSFVQSPSGTVYGRHSPSQGASPHSGHMVQSSISSQRSVLSSTRKPPPPFLEESIVSTRDRSPSPSLTIADPFNKNDRSSFYSSSTSSSSLNPVHVHPMALADPFADPKNLNGAPRSDSVLDNANPFDDPAHTDFGVRNGAENMKERMSLVRSDSTTLGNVVPRLLVSPATPTASEHSRLSAVSANSEKSISSSKVIVPWLSCMWNLLISPFKQYGVAY
jgi:hypothetical protein